MVMSAERKAQSWRSRTIGRRGERTANGNHLTDNNYTAFEDEDESDFERPNEPAANRKQQKANR